MKRALASASVRSPALPHRVAQRSLADSVVVLEVGWVLVTVLRRALTGDDGIPGTAAWAVLALVVLASGGYAAAVAARPPAHAAAGGLLLADGLAVAVFSSATEVPGSGDNPAVFLTGLSCIVAGLVLPGWRGIAAAVVLTTWQVLRWDATGQPWLTRVVLVAALAGIGFTAARLVRRTLLRSADQLDRLMADQLTAQRSRELVVSRSDAAAQMRRDLHGTILNTLPAIASGRWTPDLAAGGRWLARDLAVLESMSGTADRDAPDRLRETLAAIVEEVGSRGLRVATRYASVPEPPPVVSRLMAEAVREALMNVSQHAGTESAELTVEPGQDGELLIEVTDRGRGADPERLDQGLGLTETVVGALQSVGGRASLQTRPGHGTRVLLRGPRPAATAPPGVVPGLPALTSVDGPRSVAFALLVLSGPAAAIGLTTSWPAYREPVAQVVALLLLAAALPWALYDLRRDPSGRHSAAGRWRWAPALVAVPTVILVSGVPLEGCERMEYPMYMGTPALLVAMSIAMVRSNPARFAAGTGFVAAYALLAAPLASAGQPCATNAVNLSANAVLLLVAAAVLLGGLRRHAATAHSLLGDAEAAHRANAARDAAREEGRRMLAAIGNDVAATIRGLASGRDDPRDPAVRERCREHADRLRTALDGPRSDDQLRVALTRLTQVTRETGPRVTVRGHLPRGAVAGADVEAVVTAVATVLEAVAGRASRAVITLLATGSSAHVLLRVEEVRGVRPPTVGIEISPGTNGLVDWRLDVRLVRPRD